MKSLSLPLVATLAALTLAGQARADLLNWSYSTSTNPPVVTAGTGTVQITGVTNGMGGSAIPLLALQDSSAATSTSPDVYHSTYALTVTVTDNTTHDSGTLTLTGLLDGKLTSTSSSVKASVSGPASLTLDGHVYTFRINPLDLTSPGMPQQTLEAFVKVTDAKTGGGSGGGNGGGSGGGSGGTAGGGSGTPEPSALVLCGLGFACVGVRGWWRRRRRPAAPVE